MFKRLAAASVILVIVSLLAVSCGKYYEEGLLTVKSPDGRIVLNFELKELEPPYSPGKNMYYNVSVDGKKLLRDSPLGLNFGEAGPLTGDVVITAMHDTSMVDEFETPLSKQAKVRAECNQLTVSLREKTIPAKDIDLIFRVYNEGVALRYHVPEQQPDIKFPSAAHLGFLKEYVITNEMTGFYFEQDHDIYCLIPPRFQHNYESPFFKIKLSEVAGEMILALPLLVVPEGGPAVCITEAALDNYAACYLSSHRDFDLDLSSALAPVPGEKDVKVIGEVPLTTPWRVIMIADSPGKLIESPLILCLNEPSRIDDISWIKPGKAAWEWWNGRLIDRKRNKPVIGGVNTDTYKFYIGFAAEAGLEYCLIDAGWYGDHKDPAADITVPIPEMDVEGLVSYADSLGVNVLLWLNWENVKKQMDKAFPLYRQWGIAGVKVDYMDRDDQEMVNFYHDVLALAAENKLVVDFHGAYKPTGIRRTWPNLITREGVLGLEYCRWSKDANPDHDVTIPYTRMLLGPMDYTPGAFLNSTDAAFRPDTVDVHSLGTRCHQLAMFVVYESPLTVLADSPVNYRKQKGLKFLSRVPTVWDETRFIAGEVGDYIVLARKKGNSWYLGAMTDWTARELSVPLDFLGGGSWKVSIWADGKKAEKDPQDVDVSESQVSAGESLAVVLAPGGGLAAVFEPAQ
ncbi:MAG: glycoside hydrolase family 97 protein [Candidatus Glassbacteria bacterium]|nr:glycoside hydrolase family 97 protein [Candidatus Glassbacteria bacterium]